MSDTELSGRIVQPNTVLESGRIVVADATIRRVEAWTPSTDRVLTPGFVDLQVNGYGGIDLMTCTAAEFRELGRMLVHSGVTSFLPTLITNPIEVVARQLDMLAEAFASWPDDAAQPLGFHLEGPFLNPTKHGAHPIDHVRTPDVRTLDTLLEAGRGHVRLVTIAPEVEGARELIELLVARGVTVALGHSAASYEQAVDAIEHGATVCTHLGNAMTAIHHREPGLPTACLVERRVFACLIPDLVHVHAGFLRLALAAKGANGLILVTDAIAAAGLADGDYTLAGQPVRVTDGVCRDAGGTIAGAALRFDDGIRRFSEATQCNLVERSLVSATNASRALGVEDRLGSLQPGRRADVLEWDRDKIAAIWLRGRRLPGRGNE